MNFSPYVNKYQTASFHVGVIRAAVEEHQAKHGGLGNIEVVTTHISSEDYTAQGHAQSELDGVVIEVERIARRKVEEANKRKARLAGLHAKVEAGEISEEEYLTEAYCFI